MLRYPVFGLGIGNFERAEGTISEFAQAQAARHAGFKWSAPHNSWVEAGAETGIPGLIVWVMLVVGSAYNTIKLRKRIPRAWATSTDPDQRFLYLATLFVPIAALGFIVCATFVSFAWSDQSYVLPAIALGIQKAFDEQAARAGLPAPAPDRDDESPSSRATKYFVAALSAPSRTRASEGCAPLPSPRLEHENTPKQVRRVLTLGDVLCE